MPAPLEMPADIRPSRIAAASSDGSTPSLAPSANCASASERASPILASARRNLPCTTVNSIILAMKMVQVTSEANARPIITALTMMSADMNIDHGDNSRRATVVDFNGVGLSPAIAIALGAAGDNAEGEATAGGDACEAGAVCCAAMPEGSCATGRC